MRYGVEYAEQEREWTRSENAPRLAPSVKTETRTGSGFLPPRFFEVRFKSRTSRTLLDASSRISIMTNLTESKIEHEYPSWQYRSDARRSPVRGIAGATTT